MGKLKPFQCEDAVFIWIRPRKVVSRRESGHRSVSVYASPGAGLEWRCKKKTTWTPRSKNKTFPKGEQRENQRPGKVRRFVCWQKEYCDCGLIVRMGELRARKKVAAPPFSMIFFCRQITPQRLYASQDYTARSTGELLDVRAAMHKSHPLLYLRYWSAGTGLAEPGISLGRPGLQGCGP